MIIMDQLEDAEIPAGVRKAAPNENPGGRFVLLGFFFSAVKVEDRLSGHNNEIIVLTELKDKTKKSLEK